jgi:hypothetical protein
VVREQPDLVLSAVTFADMAQDLVGRECRLRVSLGALRGLQYQMAGT